MISPMRAYRILAFHRGADALLGLLKDRGVLHVKRLKREEGEAFAALRRQEAETKRLRAEFQRRLPGEDPLAGGPSAEGQPPAAAPDPAALPEALAELERLDARVARLEEDLFYYRHVGAFDRAKLDALAARGLYLHLFSVPLGRLDERWGNEHALVPLFDAGRKTWFAVASRQAKRPSLPAQAEEFPDRSVPELEAELDAARRERLALLAGFYHNRAAYEAWLDRRALAQRDALQDERARVQSVALGFGKVILLQGWVPEDRAAELEAALDAGGYYYEAARPAPKDAPPVQLHNGRFGRLFEPIAELFALPDYAELDLTPFFAPFFLLFFGLCLGDGGYGLLLFLVLLALARRVPDRYRKLWGLALCLEAGAAVLGIVSGTFFGINLHEAPWPWLDAIRPGLLDADQLFALSLILGAVQIAFGLILQAANRWRQFGPLHAVAPLGWLALLGALGYGYLEAFTMPVQVLAWAGVALVLFFSAPDAGFGARIGQGIWALYGITGFFGDLLSYIRLFALGLAGAILGFVVNDIAASLLGTGKVLGPVLFVLLLIVGHGLNLFIVTLGAFVHPMRLTFVEFYKNAGFTGGGEPYRPLVRLPLDAGRPSAEGAPKPTNP